MGNKMPGLTPDKIIKAMAEVANGKGMRGMRGKDKKGKQVLSEGCETGIDSSGEGGIFGEADRTGGESPEISDVAGDTADSNFRTQLSRVLKKKLSEPAPYVDGLPRIATNAEMLAAVVQREAFLGKQWACEFWRDMAEGKPVRAAQQNNNDAEIESHLDRVSLANLNRLVETKG